MAGIKSVIDGHIYSLKSSYDRKKILMEKLIGRQVEKKLLKEAYANSLAKVKDNSPTVNGQTIIKAIYSKKKRPGIGK